MESSHITECLQASREETFFLQNMDDRVGEEPASNSFNHYTRVHALHVDMWAKEVMFWLT